MNVKRFLIAATIAFVLVSCKGDRIYKEILSFKDYRWQRIAEDNKSANSIEFTDIEVKDNQNPYDIYVGIRHSSIINVDKIRFMMEIISPNGTMRTSVHMINLKDREGKKFIGDVMGDLYDIEERIKSFVSFTETGRYTIRITNLASVFEVIGIIDMSLRIVKSDLNYEI